MKFFYLLLVITVAKGFVLKDNAVAVKDTEERNSNELPNTQSLTYMSRGPWSLSFGWAAAVSDDAEDPVIGYKVTVSEYRRVVKKVGGVEKCVAEEYPLRPPRVFTTNEMRIDDIQLKSPNAENRILIQSLSLTGRVSSGFSHILVFASSSYPDFCRVPE